MRYLSAIEILQTLDVSAEDHHNVRRLADTEGFLPNTAGNKGRLSYVKANQKLTYQDIQCLFEPESPPKDEWILKNIKHASLKRVHHEAKAQPTRLPL